MHRIRFVVTHRETTYEQTADVTDAELKALRLIDGEPGIPRDMPGWAVLNQITIGIQNTGTGFQYFDMMVENESVNGLFEIVPESVPVGMGAF